MNKNCYLKKNSGYRTPLIFLRMLFIKANMLRLINYMKKINRVFLPNDSMMKSYGESFELKT